MDVGIRTAQNALPRRGFARLRRPPVRRPLAEGVVEHAGEVTLARDARPDRDAGLTVRVAAAAAASGLPLSASTLQRLAEASARLTLLRTQLESSWSLLGKLDELSLARFI